MFSRLPKLFILFFFFVTPVFAKISNDLVIEHNGNISKYVYYFADENEKYSSPTQIPNNLFEKSNQATLNFQFKDHPYWLRFTLKPLDKTKAIYLRIANPNLEDIELYYIDSNTNKYNVLSFGEKYAYKYREINALEYIVELPHSVRGNNVYYLRVKSSSQLLIPMYIGNSSDISSYLSITTLLSGIYLGIMLVMAIYNFFIYTVIKDRSYLLYVAYILITTLIQSDSLGISYKYLWPNHPSFNKYAHLLFPTLIGFISLRFFYRFLNFKKHNPKIIKFINIFISLYFLAFSIAFFDWFTASYISLQFLALCASLFVLYHSGLLAIKGNRTARFFIMAWGVFLLSVIIFVLKNFNIIPSNIVTINILHLGSAIEVVLLSFALADKINIYKEEKEISQLETLRISEENAKLIFEQNIILEKRVGKRTEQLQKLNNELKSTLHSLKETQSQLVDSEKMASLGQLTAGIAHEINNPINFVTSNIKPLEMDIEDLNAVLEQYDNIKNAEEFENAKIKIENFKKEIDINFLKEEIKTLLSGVKEGAVRTAEIVKSLKTFSRLDEFDMKPINLNEGIESTLVLIRNLIPKELILIKELGDIPKVECLGGKLNQVFMNLITNGIQAIKMKERLNDKEYLTIKTFLEGERVFISIEDSGIGIPDKIKNRIYEPFFSTKDVGEGSGLGLSIVKSIIDSHRGTIDLYSEAGKGTEFIIGLPITQ